jgi:hypothetical protein
MEPALPSVFAIEFLSEGREFATHTVIGGLARFFTAHSALSGLGIMPRW